MTAKIKYDNGWVMEMPNEGNAPMLFLEWVSQFKAGEMPLDKIIDSDFFQIRFHVTKKEIEKCVEYINNNL
jgi:hypothetical protein